MVCTLRLFDLLSSYFLFVISCFDSEKVSKRIECGWNAWNVLIDTFKWCVHFDLPCHSTFIHLTILSFAVSVLHSSNSNRSRMRCVWITVSVSWTVPSWVASWTKPTHNHRLRFRILCAHLCNSNQFAEHAMIAIVTAIGAKIKSSQSAQHNTWNDENAIDVSIGICSSTYNMLRHLKNVWGVPNPWCIFIHIHPISSIDHG